MLENDDTRVATDVAYNAAELCARALILLKTDFLPSRHGRIVQKFSQLYVKDGPLDKTVGRGISQGLEHRGDARYKPEAKITKKEALHNINLAKKLITFLASKLKQK